VSGLGIAALVSVALMVAGATKHEGRRVVAGTPPVGRGIIPTAPVTGTEPLLINAGYDYINDPAGVVDKDKMAWAWKWRIDSHLNYAESCLYQEWLIRETHAMGAITAGEWLEQVEKQERINHP
jgi:hypothetical protein